MMLLVALEIIIKTLSFLFLPYYLRILLILSIDIFNLIFIKDKFFKYFSVLLSLFFFKNFEFFNSQLLKEKIYLVEGKYIEDNKMKLLKINDKEINKNIVFIFKNFLKLKDGNTIKGNFRIKREIFNKISACYFAEIISIENVNRFPIRDYIKEIIFEITYNCDKITYRFFNSIVLGEQYKLGKNILKIFKATGLIHILALSGLHFHLLTYIFTLILSLIKLNKKLENIILFLLLTLYFFVANFSPSLLRAYLMESFKILSKALGEKGDNLKSFYFSLIISLIIKKKFLLELSFQMSYIATLAVLVASKRTKNILYMNLTIFIFVAPLQLIYFKSINFSSILYNLIFIPIFSLIIKLIFLSIILFPLPFKLSELISFTLSKVINLLLLILEFLSNKFKLIIDFNFNYFISFLIFIVIFLLKKERYIYEKFKKLFLLSFKQHR